MGRRNHFHRRRGTSRFGFARTTTKAKGWWGSKSKHCASPRRLIDGNLAKPGRAGVDPASETTRVAPAWDRESGGFAHALSAALRRSASISGISARRKRPANLFVWRSNQDTVAAFRRLEKNLRSNHSRIECERLKSATRLSLVQFALRAKNDRDRTATRRFRQTPAARQTHLHGSS